MIPRIARHVVTAAAIAGSLAFAATAFACDSGVAVRRPSLSGVQGQDPICVLVVPIYVVAPAVDLQPGCGREYVLLGGPGGPGEHGLLEFPDCLVGTCSEVRGSGEPRLRCLLAYGSSCLADSASSLSILPGARSGAVRSAIEARFAQDVDRREGMCYADYHGNGARVVVVPLTTAPDAAGRGLVNVTGYASFFLKNIPGNGAADALRCEFIGGVAR
jgi:hypothetical protein